MAPVCVPGRLLLLQCLVFLVFSTLVITQIKSLLVYDRQFLLDIRHNVRTLDAFKHGEQKTVPPLLAGIPTHLCRALALPPRRKRLRRRGKRGGRLVKLKAWLAGSSTISRTELGLIHPFVVPRRFLDPIGACLVPVTGSFAGLQPRRSCPPRLSQRGVDLRLLKTLPRSRRSTEPQPPAPARIGLRLGSVPVSAVLWSNFYHPAVLILTPRGRRAVEEERRLFLNELNSWFHSSCRTILDSVAPLKTVQLKVKPEPWLNERTRAARQDCRKAERRWNKDKLQVSYQILKNCWRCYQSTVKEAKRQHLSNLVQSNHHNLRVLFKTIEAVLNPPQVCIEASSEMCNSFLQFFIDKVSTARALVSTPASDPSDLVPCLAVFDLFKPVSLKDLEDVVDRIKPSGSPCDSIPPHFFKEVFPSIGQTVLAIINSSLSSGVVPQSFKHAVVQPLLKKPSLDPGVLANFRPISKLPFISKILEKVVFTQLKSFLDEHEVLEVFQSGFKTLHSTESALLRVFIDILMANDSGDYVTLLLLDLSSAFDTVDHSILMSRLQRVSGTALDWFRSYLADRTMCVSLGGSESRSTPLSYGVPQGSILGPLLFSLYLLPLGSILRKHGISLHCYADDTQIYVPLKKKDAFSLKPLLLCLEDIKAWMSLNFLKFNENKKEVMVFSPSGSCALPVDLGPLVPYRKQTITNLGFKMDSDFKLDRQISAIVKSSFFHLRQLAKVKPFLAQKHFETVIHAFITSRLDYCNALYLGVSQSSLARLQLVQNAAARLLTGTHKREHITPILASLHWLPVHFRVHFKILLFVFKCLNGLAPPYLSVLLRPYTPARCLRGSGRMFNYNFSTPDSIPSIWSCSRTATSLRHHNKRQVHLSNLRPLPQSSQPVMKQRHLKLALLNTRSLNNKSLILNEFITDNNLDFLCITETWHKPLDYFSLNQTTPTGYTYMDKPRPEGRGGGVAAFYRKDIKTSTISIPATPSFKHLTFKLSGPTPLGPHVRILAWISY
ncbi:RNA-directed DNA polymerase from mobile element jockey [Collichthys lucidus]|uniref:RNA-directed DNA polymerase from mobile element jockey n=1 Tax=Collichthys lucidus TaxID=240159 RepID=A0A4V6ALP9_COLLU|nr:RNA-directed DNA polymerase from mobile element jockey [Collichthys lucidus]